MAQYLTSKNTSVNSTKLPAIFKKIDWEFLKFVYKKEQNKDHFVVFDIGCGAYTEHIGHWLSQREVGYYAYDPYWYGHTQEMLMRNYRSFLLREGNQGIIICSNTLNVICPWPEVLRTKALLYEFKAPWFVSVYEGNKSGIGGISKDDCWQWNRRLKEYATIPHEITRKGVLTEEQYKQFIV